MQSSLDSSVDTVDADAMDLYTSHPPSLGPEQLDASPFPSLPFSGNAMEALFPETTPSIFDDTLVPVASTSGSTPTSTTARPSTAVSINDNILPSLSLPADTSAVDPSPAQLELDFDDLQTTAGSSSSRATAIPSTSSLPSASLASSKRGRGRPRKAPNAPTRSKYARITKEEMSEEDDDIDFQDRFAWSSKSSSTGTPKPSSTTSIKGKGKERFDSRNNSSSNSNSDATAAATTTTTNQGGLKGKRPAHLVETRTKSGRTVHKPEVYVPTFEPSFRRRKLPQQRASTESLQCSVCGQGNSPSANQIVLCDGCNTPYHQLCHDPIISKEVITGPEKLAWYCHQCDLQRTNQFPTLSWQENVTASHFPMDVVQAYLKILPQPNLVKTVLDFIQHYPEARLFPPNLPRLVEADTARRDQMRQARQYNVRPSETPSLGESHKRKRQPESSSSHVISDPSQHYFRELSNDDNIYSDTEGRVSKALRKDGGQEGNDAGRIPSSPSKGNATTQTDDYYPESDERGVRFPSHPEDRPGSMSYFEMLRNALKDINDPEGVPPRRLYEWISEKYALPDNFRPSAGQALQKAAKKGHFLKNGSLYRVNPEHENTKAVKRPIRKSRQSDTNIPQSSNTQHERNISNQTTNSSKSNLTSISSGNDTTTSTTHQKSESFNELNEILQGETTTTIRPSGVSLEEVIARQNNNTSTPSNTPNISNQSPGITFATATATPSIRPSGSPLAIPANPSPGIGTQYYAHPNTFDPAPRVHQRHRSSVSYGTTRPFVDPSQASLASQQQMPHLQQHPGSHISVPAAVQAQRSIDPQSQVHGHGSSGDAGIDSMLADLMRQQSPNENMTLSGQHQHQRQQQQIPYAAIPVRSNDTSRQRAIPPAQPTSLTPQQVQARQQAQQAQQAQQQRAIHQHQQQPHMTTQQQQQIHQQRQHFQAQHPYISNHPTDTAIFTSGTPQNQYTQPHAPNPHMQGYNPQYGFQNVQQQQQQQRAHHQQQQNQQVTAAALQAQYNRSLGQGQDLPRQE